MLQVQLKTRFIPEFPCKFAALFRFAFVVADL